MLYILFRTGLRYNSTKNVEDFILVTLRYVRVLLEEFNFDAVYFISHRVALQFNEECRFHFSIVTLYTRFTRGV